ncbi:Protein of unknown function [Pyronema omphalodes CBS 100304]|uniref:Uncharacterized protein n=1 Tax=Pyronema omphalodes (strain CBS 100304) TaxID=1076935 RepID=U4KXF8_PYROM|nr:Protein of unknown function [Pyronema omphalodes CBS 100304]
MLLDLLKLGTWKLLWITEDAGIASFPVNLRIISPGRVEWVVLRIEK